MKKKHIYTLLAIVLFASSSYAQCYKMTLCDTKSDGYDYTGQSSFTRLMPGDTAQFEMIFYSSKSYRVQVCAQDVLGDVNFSVFYKTKDSPREVKEVIKKRITVFKTDEYGQRVYDGDYKPIVEGEKWVSDTIWHTPMSLSEIVFDTQRDKKTIWDIAKLDRSRRVVVQVTVPANEQQKYTRGCVSVLVGYK